MFTLLGSGILGSLIGGIFRLAPEVLKLMDKKDERAHELAMFERQVDLEKTRGQIKLDEIGAQRDASVDVGAMDALNAAIKQQADMASAAGGLAAKLSALVRPLLTFWIWALYSAAFLVLGWITWQVSHDPAQMVKLVLTSDFMALLCGITNYWFLDRTLAKRGLA
ncbi:hypothetical protein [Pseudomonas sp.]|uniref:hypothetical protein n=1 Tax=Pseudomonas sp. TaxID=306 RepID=UPI002589AA37|nr:hypothetical protein [Pseudomonas sp.]